MNSCFLKLLIPGVPLQRLAKQGYVVCAGEAAKQGAGCLFLRIDMLVPGGGVVLILK